MDLLTLQGFHPLVAEEPMPARVRRLLAQFTRLWWECPEDLPVLGPVYSVRSQLDRERQLDRVLNTLTAELRTPPPDESERQERQERIAALLVGFAKEAFGLQDRQIEAVREYGFLEIGVEFSRQARAFDPSIREADIFQASRNVWSMNLMQLLLGMPLSLTPATFAYSMLYPYSDNYLDDPAIPLAVKASFNQRFRQRLAGEAIIPANHHEEKISALIGMIEDQFERRRYPRVYESLLAIHLAQSRSLALLRPKASPFEVDVLGICFEKGGTSVLADGYLVAGELTPSQEEFMFHYGAFTQLMDDLEDVRADLQAGLQTVFSHTAQNWPLDTVTNRALHFGSGLVERMAVFDAPGAGQLKDLVAASLTPLLIAEAGLAGRLYRGCYLRTLQAHFPFRFGFLAKQQRLFSGRGISATALVEILAHSQLIASL